MRLGERVDLIKKVARTLSEQSWDDLSLVLRQANVSTPNWSFEEAERYPYCLLSLEDADEGPLVELDDYLHSATHGSGGRALSDGRFRLFVTHAARRKAVAANLKDPRDRARPPTRDCGGPASEVLPTRHRAGVHQRHGGGLDAAFSEMFPSVTGASRVKAIRFFLSAAEYAGVPRSPLWKAPKAGAIGPRRGRPKRQNGADPQVQAPAPRTGQSLREFALPSGRTLTLSIDGDVLALDRSERKFVMGIVDQIEEHVEQHPLQDPQAAETPAEDQL